MLSSSTVSKELEDAASGYVAEAIRLDSQGSRGMAIKSYQQAISTLIKLARLYPDYKLNRLYLERAMAYQQRIRALQSAQSLSPERGEGPSRHQPPQTVESLKASYSDLVLKEKPNVGWEDVVGLEDAKRALKESIVFPAQRPDLFPLGYPRGILLFGPPGCGKTLLAAAAASEIDAHFITVDASSIMDKWLGNAEKNVARLFSSARKMLGRGHATVIIFIDEVDSLMGSRSHEVGGEARVRNQFVKEMDGIVDKGRSTPLYVVGATNRPWQLDWPFLRRFQKRILVPLPDLRSRTNMLRLYTRPLKLEVSIQLEELGRLTEGYTGSDVRDICIAAQLQVVSELFESGRALDSPSQPREITMEDFKDALKTRRPSVSAEMIRAYVSWSQNYMAL